jgi:WhiB family redox-sensing transcriptional regulator
VETVLLGRCVSQPRVTGPAPGENWRSAAACQDADPDLFFPVSGSGKSLEQVERARAVCAVCPVRRACLAFAVRTGQAHGIWGGLTEEERRRQPAPAGAGAADPNNGPACPAGQRGLDG